MTGISTVKSRRLPASLSSNPMEQFLAPTFGEGALAQALCTPASHRLGTKPRAAFPRPAWIREVSIVARHRADGRDDFFIGHFVSSAHEARVAAIREDDPVM